ncbi:MAG: O-antigen ligase family protein [Terracidiphilus sp.]
MNNSSLASDDLWPGGEAAALEQGAAHLHVGIWRKTILWMVGAYIVMNSGFEMVRIPPVGAGIPVGELVLVFSLCVINVLVLLPKMAREVWLLPILVWWGLSLSRSLLDTAVGGAWAFRDASQAIESLYLIVGFWLANQTDSLEHFFNWLRKLLLVLAFYGLLYPIASTLQEFSPRLRGMSTGHTPTLFFQVTNTPEMLIWAVCWLLLERSGRMGVITRTLWASFLLAFSVAFAQSRTTYIAVLGVGAILTMVMRRMAVRWAVVILLGVAAIGAVAVSGVNLKGRTGHRISLDYLANHLESASGSAESEDVESAAGGVPLRIGWWRHIFNQLKSSPENAIFGLGYGMPLTDFQGPGGITREPHNSYISVVARLGVSGLIVWILMQASLYSAWWRSYRLSRRMQWTRDQNNLILLLIFSLLALVVSIGEGAFEQPFYAIPYYFFFGVVLRYGKHLRQAAENQEMAELEET